MKKLLLTSVIYTTLTLSVSAMPKGEMNKIINLKATKTEVVNTLGDPDKILAQKERTYWWYNQDNVDIKIQWDEKESSIERMQYTSRNKRTEGWDTEWQSGLEIDKSTFAQILDELGMPDGIIVNNTERQNIVYRYSNYVLNMRFDKGVLAEYELKKA